MTHLIAHLLQGLREFEGIPILLARVSIGVFFCISGGNKLFVPQQFEMMLETITQSGIPFPYVNAVFVSFVEFFFGGLLVLGLLTPLCAVMLTGTMTVAILTNRIYSIQAHSLLNWVDDPLSAGSLVCPDSDLVDLLRAGQGQHRLPARPQAGIRRREDMRMAIQISNYCK